MSLAVEGTGERPRLFVSYRHPVVGTEVDVGNQTDGLAGKLLTRIVYHIGELCQLRCCADVELIALGIVAAPAGIGVVAP